MEKNMAETAVGLRCGGLGGREAEADLLQNLRAGGSRRPGLACPELSLPHYTASRPAGA